MILTLIRADRLFVSTLPDEVTGKHWLYDTDANGARRQLASIEAINGEWIINPQGQARLVTPEGNKVASATLRSDEGLYHLRVAGEDYSALLVERPTRKDMEFHKLGLASDCDLTIGRKPDNSFELAGEFVSSHHALLGYRQGSFYIVDLGSSNGVFVNSYAIPKQCKVPLVIGDVVFILGVKIMVGANFVAFNNPARRLTVHASPAFVPYSPQKPPMGRVESYAGLASGYFFRSPRIKRDIEEKSFDIEDPPSPTKPEETPLLLRIGPSIGMALASSFMGLYMVMNMASGEGSMLRMIPMLCMMLMMVVGAVLWPILNSRHTRKKDAEKEALRINSYAAYLDRERNALQVELANQREILCENRISVAECFNRVSSRDRRLFERTPVQSDFLSLRVGTGDLPLLAKFRWPQEKLASEGDVLRGEVLKLAREPQIVRAAPLALSLLDNHVAGVVGTHTAAYPFLRGLLVQLLTLHAANEVKIVVLSSEEERADWDFLFALPHIFDDSLQTRYLATTTDEATEISLRLERELQSRLSERAEVIGDYGAYYVVLALNHDLAKRTDLVARLSALRENKGFSVLAYARNIRDLPRECTRIVELDTLQDSVGRLYSQIYDPNDPTGARPHFLPDVAVSIQDARYFALTLASIELSRSSDALLELPRSLGFLEMFEAAKVEHLNVHSRWHDNNPCVSLATPVGADASGAPFILNIHEDYHGPHGLIAGMTGSGKSEFIIAYILSMAVNYRPNEVSFVLIDYKGGGLAGAFASEKNRLPHLAGTITNLDGGAIRRSLVSIKSELKRRQDAFNSARDLAGLGTMDIYRYQELYRSGVVAEPIPHLLIISDEFAELKDQQPEFMEELVSAARIGRSLGVHLILATQKPSGVVNDQIWSNARFKVSLKVADASDSREMLKVPDAAELTDPGRFYLLVGYNEFFALGQSAYAGTRYLPSEQFARSVDNSVVLISNTGRGLLSAKPQRRAEASSASVGSSGDVLNVAGALSGMDGASAGIAAEALLPGIQRDQPESIAVLEHLVEVARAEGMQAPMLWLDPIPELISLDYLRAKYFAPDSSQPELDQPELDQPGLDQPGLDQPGLECENAYAAGASPILNPLVGELDDPWSQSQKPLTMPLSEEGNAVIFGSTGSGKATMLATMLADLLHRHSARTLNAYLLDLGAETLGAFREAPQIGDVLFAADEEKVDMLFRVLQAEMQRRRKLLAAHDGGFLAYAARNSGGEALPTILVVINVFEVFTELFEKYLDDLVALSRDGLRYGIQFVLTTSRANGVPYRLLPNFKLTYALRLNSKDDYLSVLGSLGDVIPPESYARGLVKQDRTYEFQVAQVSEDGREVEAVRELAAAAARRADSVSARSGAHELWAPAVPALPEVVTASELFGGATKPVSSSYIPLGFTKESIEVAAWDFNRMPVMLVLGEDEESQSRFLRGLAGMLCDSQQAVAQSAAQLDGQPVAQLDGQPSPVAPLSAQQPVPLPAPLSEPLPAQQQVVLIDPDGLLEGLADTAYAGLNYLGNRDDISEFIEEISDFTGYLLLVSLRGVLSALSEIAKAAFTTWLESGNFKRLAGVVVSGEPSRFSAFSYESWFRELSAWGSGIWAGDGINGQTMLKVSQLVPTAQASPPAGFAWLVNRGAPVLIKYTTSDEDALDIY